MRKTEASPSHKHRFMNQRQVPKAHYDFSRYVTKDRWASIWHQLDEVLALQARSVLEIGPGPGLFKAIAGAFGAEVDTLDIDAELEPDYVASADDMPFEANSYDAVCAFQMLEHVPYEVSLKIFNEMARVARKAIVISLPDARPAWPYSLHIPKLGQVQFLFPRPITGLARFVFDGQHYWEVNTKGYPLRRVVADLCAAGDVRLQRTYRVKENPYHRFFVFAAKDQAQPAQHTGHRRPSLQMITGRLMNRTSWVARWMR